jgi:hypothetical protein
MILNLVKTKSFSLENLSNLLQNFIKGSHTIFTALYFLSNLHIGPICLTIP